MNRSSELNEISLQRPVLVLLLVLYHAFCPWVGAWESFEGFQFSYSYRWIAELSYSFMLPLFVFQSGYVWAFQREFHHKNDSFLQLSKKKGCRLIIPSIIFSIAYILVFDNISDVTKVDNLHLLFFQLIEGVGHMWFLPMLFWCFLMSYVLLKIRNKRRILPIIVFSFFVISIIPLPCRLNLSFGYLIFFLLGYKTLLNKELILTKVTKNNIIFIWMVFIVVFVLGILCKDYLYSKINVEDSLLTKFILVELVIFVKLFYALLGITAMYLTTLNYSSTHKLRKWIYYVGNLCFGIYLFQQFVLKYIYYYTDFPLLLGFYLPWLSFFVAFFISFLASYLVRSVPIGRKII